MAKDPSKNIPNYKIRGGQMNQFDFQRNQAAMANEERERQENLQPEEFFHTQENTELDKPTSEDSETKEAIAESSQLSREERPQADFTVTKLAPKTPAKKSVKKAATKKVAKKTTKKTSAKAAKKAPAKKAAKKTIKKAAKKTATKKPSKSAAKATKKAAAKTTKKSGTKAIKKTAKKSGRK